MHGIADLTESGHDDHSGIFSNQLGQYLQAVAIGQTHVQQHQIGGKLLGDGAGILQAFHVLALVTGFLQFTHHRPRKQHLVFHNQDFGGLLKGVGFAVWVLC